MKKLLIFLSSLFMVQNTFSKEESKKETELSKKLNSEGVLTTTRSVDAGKTGGGGNVGPKIQK